MSESNRLRGFPPRLCRPLPHHAGYPSLNANRLLRCLLLPPFRCLDLFLFLPSPFPACLPERAFPSELPLRALGSLSLPFEAFSSEPAVSPLSMPLLLFVDVVCLSICSFPSFSRFMPPKLKSPGSSSRFEDPGLSCSENKNGILFSENPAVVSVYVCVLTSTTAEPPWRARRNRAPA